MGGCRISKVTDKRTGRSVEILPSVVRSNQSEVLLEALEVCRTRGAIGVGVVLTFEGGLAWTISHYDGHPSSLVGGLAWLQGRVMNE